MDNKKYSDFMIYSTFYDTIKKLVDNGRRDAAGALALELIRYGTTGERSYFFEDRGLEARFRAFLPLIDKSKSNCQKTIERRKQTAAQMHNVTGDNR